VVNGRLLTPEQREKYDFTRTILTVLLRTVTGNEHYYAEYYVDNVGEWVDMTFDNEYRIRKVNVTGNSLLQITKDVLKTF
jgi:hypothetical protein